MGSVCQIRLKYMRNFYSDSDSEWKIRLHVNIANVSLVATALELRQLSTVFFFDWFCYRLYWNDYKRESV